MKELMDLLVLHGQSFDQIPIKGTCFVITRKNFQTIKIDTCSGNYTLTSGDWSEIATFIRSHLNNEIKIDDPTLYGYTVVECALAYVNHDTPSEDVRNKRMLKVYQLGLEHRLMKHIDR